MMPKTCSQFKSHLFKTLLAQVKRAHHYL